MPLYVRAGSILPLGPVKQYVSEKVAQPLSVAIYPGGDSSFLLYEDDGNSFNYRQGEWMGLQMEWNDHRRTLRLSLASGSRMLASGGMPSKYGSKTNSGKLFFRAAQWKCRSVECLPKTSPAKYRDG